MTTEATQTITARDEDRAEALANRLDDVFKAHRLDPGVILREDRTILVIASTIAGKIEYQSQHHIDDNMARVFNTVRRAINEQRKAAN